MRNINSIINIKTASVMTLLLFVTVFFPCFSYAQVDPTAWYGDGSAEEFFISTANELAYLATLVNDATTTFSGKTIVLTNEIDLSRINESDGGWVPIGTYVSTTDYTRAFRGTFNGNGYAIKNLSVDRSAIGQGLFGFIYTGGKVENLALIDVDIKCGQYCAGIAARLYGAVVENTYVTGYISGAQYIGGIAGYVGYTNNNSIIDNSYSLVNAIATTNSSYVGSIAGYLYLGEIRNCYSMGTIEGRNYVGGIAGAIANNDKIIDSAALNEYLIATGTSSGRIHSYSNATSTLSGNFAWDNMALKTSEESEKTPITGIPYDKQGDLKTAEEIYNPDTWSAFSDEYWEINAGHPPILKVFLYNENITQIEKYPEYLNALPADIQPEQEWYYKSDGSGTYYIKNAAELAFLGHISRTQNNFAQSTIKLTADIDLTDIDDSELSKYSMLNVCQRAPYDGGGWIPIGSICNGFMFLGTFDGEGYVINNLKIYRPEQKYQGLFAVANIVRNLGVIDAEVTGGDYTGIVGGHIGILENSFTTGSVSGNTSVGGAAGSVGNGYNSYSEAMVVNRGSGSAGELCNGTGGIFGCNNFYGTYKNLYSTGTVSSRNYGGGIVGITGWEPTTLQGLVALNESVGLSRITIIDRFEKTVDHNYAWENMLVNGRMITNHDNITVDGTSRYVHGADVTAKEIYNGTVWDANHANYSTDVWIIKEGKLPILRVFEEKNDERGGVSVQPSAIPDYIMAEVTPEVPDPEKSVVVSGINRGFQIGLADESGAWIHEPVFPDSSEIEFIVGYEEGAFTLWLGIDGVYPAVTVPDIQADEMFNVGNYFYDVEIPEGVSSIRISFPSDGMEYVPVAQAGNIALLKTGAEAWLSFEYNGIQYGDISIVLDGSGIFPELGIEPPVTLDSATPTAYVTNLNGNKNDLTVTITETYSDGSKEVFTKTFSINNNAAGSYDVGGYMVYVDTKGNTQIRECYIVK